MNARFQTGGAWTALTYMLLVLAWIAIPSLGCRKKPSTAGPAKSVDTNVRESTPQTVEDASSVDAVVNDHNHDDNEKADQKALAALTSEPSSPSESAESVDSTSQIARGENPADSNAGGDSMALAPSDVNDDKTPGQATGESTGETASSVSMSDPDTMTDGKPASQNASHYRLWIPTTVGPMLIGLDLQCSGRPLREAFDDQMAKVVQDASDAEQGQGLKWQTLLDHVAGNANLFGQMAARVSGQSKQLLKQYDRNRNSIVDEQELTRFLFRQSGFASEFRLQGSNAFRWTNRSRSPLFVAMDLNRDRRLDAAEINRAANSITRGLDQNADGCIDFAEATRGEAEVENAWPQRRFNRRGDVGMDLAGYVNWSDLSYALGGYFESQGRFQPLNPVGQIDADQNGRIETDEAKDLLGVEPAFVISIDFKDTAAPSLRVKLPEGDSPWNASDRDVIPPEGRDDLWLKNDRFTIGITTHDDSVRQERIPRVAFDQVDANNDGLIDRDELPDEAEEQLSFDSLDQNGDDMLSFEEINQAPAKRESIWNLQIRGRAAEHPDAVFAWLDGNHDHFLSTSELGNSSELLLAVLGDRDKIKSSDLPDCMVLQFGRGEPEQDTQRFRIRRLTSITSQSRPPWAIKMDSNRDGVISEDEFPGPIPAFERLDANQDHFLDANELRSENESNQEQPATHEDAVSSDASQAATVDVQASELEAR